MMLALATTVVVLPACTTSTLTYDFVSVNQPKIISTLEKNRKRVERTDLSQGLASLSEANRFAICTQDCVAYELIQPRYESGRICGEDNLNSYNIELLCFEWSDIRYVGEPIRQKLNVEAKRKDIVQDSCDAAFKRDK